MRGRARKTGIRSSLQTGELLFLMLMVLGLLALVIANAYSISFQEIPGGIGPVPLNVSLVGPADERIYPTPGRIIFRANVDSSFGYANLALRLALEQEPGDGDTIYTTPLKQGETLNYSIFTADYLPGTYYWSIKAVDEANNEIRTEVRRFVIEEPVDEEYELPPVDVSVPPFPENPPGSDSGGLGGHTSDPSGEKTAFFYSLEIGDAATIWFNKTNTHGIEKIVIHALKPLGPNGFIIHQEFEKEKTYIIPDDDDLYKAIHIQTTTSWDPASFQSTIYFHIPKGWLLFHERDPREVVLHAYMNEKFRHVPTILDHEEAGSYVYRATLQGIPPFFIGADEYTWDGIPIDSQREHGD